MPFNWREFLIGSQGQPDRNRWTDADYIRSTAQQGIAGAQNRQAPQAGRTTISPVATVGGIDQGNLNQVRAREMALADDLGRVASGQQAGAGELAVQRQGQRAMSNAAGAATMNRGSSAIGGARAAARAAGAIGLGTAGQAQQAAMGDQASARAQLAGVLGQTGGRDLGFAGLDLNRNLANMSAENQRIFQQAGLDQSTSLANMQARLQAMGMNDAAIANYLQTLGVMNQGELAARGQDNGVLGLGLQALGQAL